MQWPSLLQTSALVPSLAEQKPHDLSTAGSTMVDSNTEYSIPTGTVDSYRGFFRSRLLRPHQHGRCWGDLPNVIVLLQSHQTAYRLLRDIHKRASLTLANRIIVEKSRQMHRSSSFAPEPTCVFQRTAFSAYGTRRCSVRKIKIRQKPDQHGLQKCRNTKLCMISMCFSASLA